MDEVNRAFEREIKESLADIESLVAHIRSDYNVRLHSFSDNIYNANQLSTIQIMLKEIWGKENEEDGE